MEHMLAYLGGYVNGWQLIALVFLIVLIIVWLAVRRRQ